MKNELAMLRKQAGLSYSTNKKPVNKKSINESISKVQSLDIEADILRGFSNLIREFSNIKDRLEQPNSYGMMVNKQVKQKIDKEKLYELSINKLELLKVAIKECFNNYEEEEENDDVVKTSKNSIHRIELDSGDEEEDEDDDEDYDYEDEEDL